MYNPHSFDCVGRLKEPHEFVWKQITHRNEYCHCIFTPLKGMIKFLLTALDADATIGLMQVVLDDAKPAICVGCGAKGHVGAAGFYMMHDKVYCPFCILRVSGVVTWDGERYVWSLGGPH